MLAWFLHRENMLTINTMLIFTTETQAPGSSAILASTAASERGFLLIQKHSNLKIFLYD